MLAFIFKLTHYYPNACGKVHGRQHGHQYPLRSGQKSPEGRTRRTGLESSHPQIQQ
jgi:hypothetical protein